MNKCLNCGKDVKNKYCNVSCQNSHQNKDKILRKYGEIKEFEVNCSSCGEIIVVKEREKIFPKKKRYYCNLKCSNKRKHDDVTKEKIKNSILKYRIINPRKKKIISSCLNCEKEITSNKERKFCSKNCSNEFHIKNGDYKKWSIIGGRKSVLCQNKRSKNEILFAELCKNEFENVRLNEQIFNGWDSDIILDDYELPLN